MIGTGNIGGTLGQRLAAAGYDVVYGVRRASGPDGGQGPGGAPALPVGQALSGADAVVVAIPGAAVAGFAEQFGADLAGKVVVDAANNMGAAEVNSRAVFASGAPAARYVRAFNTLGWENFADPPSGACLFFAADPLARPVAEELITAVGLEPVFVGGAEAAGTVDGVLPLWLALARLGGSRRLAFRLVR